MILIDFIVDLSISNSDGFHIGPEVDIWAYKKANPTVGLKIKNFL
jgi:hypothetical protein